MRRLPLVLVIAFVVLPIIEIYLLIQVGQAIGPWWTVLLLVLDSIAGAWLVKHEWRGTWRALNDAIARGRMPNRELLDAGLVIVGGTLLLTPGFVSDVLGFFLILPITRPLARAALAGYITRRVTVVTASRAPRTGSAAPDAKVVRGEVIDEER